MVYLDLDSGVDRGDVDGRDVSGYASELALDSGTLHYLHGRAKLFFDNLILWCMETFSIFSPVRRQGASEGRQTWRQLQGILDGFGGAASVRDEFKVMLGSCLSCGMVKSMRVKNWLVLDGHLNDLQLAQVQVRWLLLVLHLPHWHPIWP